MVARHLSNLPILPSVRPMHNYVQSTEHDVFARRQQPATCPMYVASRTVSRVRHGLWARSELRKIQRSWR